MRFQTKADIWVEEATPVKKNNDDKDQYQTTKQMNVENKENLLNLNVPKVKKQKTMSTTRNDKQTNKKCSIKKSETKTSKWSTNVKNIKKEFKSTARSKTIERQFTISSSISSIRWLSKKKENQRKQKLARWSFIVKQKESPPPATLKRKVTKRERFNALSLNIKMIKNQSAPQLSPIKHADNKIEMFRINKQKIKLDPSIEKSLEKLNDIESQSKSNTHNIIWF